MPSTYREFVEELIAYQIIGWIVFLQKLNNSFEGVKKIWDM